MTYLNNIIKLSITALLVSLITNAFGQKDSTARKPQREYSLEVQEMYRSDTVLVDSGENGTYRIIFKSYNYGKDSNAFIRTHWFQFDFGLTNFQSAGGIGFGGQYRPLDLNNGKTFHLNLGIVQQGVKLGTPKLRFVYGLGYEWNNYRFNNSNIRLVQDSDELTWMNDTAANSKKSKLVAQYINVPLMLSYQPKFNNNLKAFKVSAGVELAYLVRSYTKARYDGKKDKTVGNYNIEPFKLSGVLRIGTNGFQLFAKYGTSFFKTGEGPEMNPVSLGLTINPFN